MRGADVILAVAAINFVLAVTGMYGVLLWRKYAAPPRPGRHRTGTPVYDIFARLDAEEPHHAYA